MNQIKKSAHKVHFMVNFSPLEVAKTQILTYCKNGPKGTKNPRSNSQIRSSIVKNFPNF